VTALARWNALAPPYGLHSGKTLRLVPPPQVAHQSPAARQPPAVPQTPAGRRPVPGPAPTQWRWPFAAPRPLDQLVADYASERSGMRFRLPEQAPAIASAAGQVVYAGAGLAGYERLLILRHGGGLMSAYSFDGQARVREGQRVKVGQPLADISQAGIRARALYFELRRNGAPVDPKRTIR
jgi:lipoprotein NlpD